MSKIFVVNKYSFNYDKRYDIRPVKMFLTKKEAEIWIENNFVLAINTDPKFSDFKIRKVNLTETDPILSPKSTTKGDKWIYAEVSKDFKDVEILGFMKGNFDSNETCFYSKTIHRYRVIYRIPKGIKTRSEIVEYVKSCVKVPSKEV